MFASDDDEGAPVPRSRYNRGMSNKEWINLDWSEMSHYWLLRQNAEF
jgi:hypothetical protein